MLALNIYDYIKKRDLKQYSVQLPFTLLFTVFIGLFVAYLFGGTFLDQIYTLIMNQSPPPATTPPISSPITPPVTTPPPIAIGSRMELLTPYFISKPSMLRVIQAIGSVFTAIPAIIFVVYYIRRKFSHIGGYNISSVWMGAFAGLGFFAVILYFWSGFSGIILRISEYGTILSIIALALILGCNKISKRTYRFLIAVCSIAIVIAAILSVTPSYHYLWNQNVTYQEREGIDWAVDNLPENSVFFSDIRLGMHLILQQRLNIVGVTDSFVIPADIVVRQMENIYYTGDHLSAYQEIQDLTLSCRGFSGTNDVYVILSNRMTHSNVGIRAFDFYYKPAPIDFLDKFIEGPEFSTIFQNDVIWIFFTQFHES